MTHPCAAPRVPRIRHVLCAALCACLLSGAGPSAAQVFGTTPPRASALPRAPEDPDLRRGFAAYRSGDNTAAYAAYLRVARRGQPIGQYNVAMMTFNGEGTRADPAASAKWLALAAHKGFALAQYNLGLLYENGDGVERSQTEASTWFLRAAEHGNVDAQLAIATQYLLGRGIEQSDAGAAQWYERAAEGGNADAQYSIASCYEHGDGVAVDSDRAIYWYAEAGKQGDRAAIEKVRVMSEARARERQ
jgi:uncharacterized protein